MSRLTRDGTAEPHSRHQELSGANGDRENGIFPVQLTTSRVSNHTQLMPSLLKLMSTHMHIISEAVRPDLMVGKMLSENLDLGEDFPKNILSRVLWEEIFSENLLRFSCLLYTSDAADE